MASFVGRRSPPFQGLAPAPPRVEGHSGGDGGEAECRHGDQEAEKISNPSHGASADDAVGTVCPVLRSIATRRRHHFPRRIPARYSDSVKSKIAPFIGTGIIPGGGSVGGRMSTASARTIFTARMPMSVIETPRIVNSADNWRPCSQPRGDLSPGITQSQSADFRPPNDLLARSGLPLPPWHRFCTVGNH